MKPKYKINQLREQDAIQERFDALTDLSQYIKENKIVALDQLDQFVVDQWESEGGK